MVSIFAPGIVVPIPTFPPLSYRVPFTRLPPVPHFGIYPEVRDPTFESSSDEIFAFHVVLSASVINLLLVSVAIFAGRIFVPFHAPVAMVPRVVIFEVPAQVESAVFSTFESPTDHLSNVCHVLSPR